MSHSGKVVFITGANRGIGLETAVQLGKQGLKLVLGIRSRKSGDETVKILKDQGIEAVALEFDVNNISQHKAVEQYIQKTFGHLDILINNAGIMVDNAEADGSFKTSNTAQDALRKTFDANFFNLIALTQTLLPLIQKSAAGRIVNLSSILGSLTLHSDPKSPIYNSKAFAYNASKTALNAFTVHLAYELKDSKIKVNSAHPGWVKTDMGGANASLEIADGAKTSVQLALIPDNGPTGGFFHLGETLPW
jgi:NAD(P)-dependent dehydrogenase (short-subunit alcohol dehydrogenase family)